MSDRLPRDINEQIKRHMASGRYSSEDEVHRELLNAFVMDDAEIRAVEKALDEIDHGVPGVPLDEAFAAIREKYGISTDR